MKDKILAYLIHNGETTPAILAAKLNISRQLTHRYLKKLLAEKQVLKIGTAPNVYYKHIPKSKKETSNLPAEDQLYLEQNFIEITTAGQFLKGVEAFSYWCTKRELPIQKTYDEYRKTLLKYDAYKKGNVISGKEKLANTKGFNEVCLTDVFYLDFYAIERFGKTSLGKLIHYGKQSQSLKLLNAIVDKTKNDVLQLIKRLKIDAVGYIPPTITRQIQIMNVLEASYAIGLPNINLVKVKGEIVVPQKALSKLADRIENTQQSIMVADNRKFNKVLLIDDAIGSGATINETACKLLKKEIAQEVYGLAITGSYKGFEVITEA